MAWEWSHTNEAYHAAERNLRKQSLKWLRVVYCEWAANSPRKPYDPDDEDYESGFDIKVYNETLAHLKKGKPSLTKEELADYIWERMSDQSTCENGGFEAWACPFGCGCHLISFSR